jgi:hypothetical protein
MQNKYRWSSQDQLDTSSNVFLFHRNIVYSRLQPLSRYLVANSVAFATITIKDQDRKGNIRQQIIDQVCVIRNLEYIDTDRMANIGHSNGGYIMLQMIVNEYKFLRDNFKLGVGLASLYINESWRTLITCPKTYVSNNKYAFKYAVPVIM